MMMLLPSILPVRRCRIFAPMAIFLVVSSAQSAVSWRTGTQQARVIAPSLTGPMSGIVVNTFHDYTAGKYDWRFPVEQADSGTALNMELYTPNLCAGQANWQCRALGFYDVARGTRNHALPGEIVRTTVGSTGLGLRIAMGNAVNLQLDYGHVVQEGASTGSRNKLHFRVGFAY
jgi:hypothetical protein